MEKTGCKIICGASTTLAVKGLMMMMMSCCLFLLRVSPSLAVSLSPFPAMVLSSGLRFSFIILRFPLRQVSFCYGRVYSKSSRQPYLGSIPIGP